MKLAFALLLGACATSAPARSAAETLPRQAQILSATGAAIGHATFTEASGGVLIRVELFDDALPPGWHGLHLHSVGACADNAANFQASGAHVGHDGAAQHGLLNPAGPEAGDLPNLYAPQAGAFAANSSLRTSRCQRKRTISKCRCSTPTAPRSSFTLMPTISAPNPLAASARAWRAPRSILRA